MLRRVVSSGEINHIPWAYSAFYRFQTQSSSNTNTRSFGDSAWLDEGLKSATTMQQQGLYISKDIAYHLVHECTKQQDLQRGRKIQAVMLYGGLDSVAVLADHLVRLFGSCGSLNEANQSFGKVINPSAHTWNAIIAAHVKLGKCEAALQLYHKMQAERTNSDKFTFLSILKACTTLGAIDQGRRVHEQINETGLQFDIVVGSALVDMYSKCGNLEKARDVFDIFSNEGVVLWNTMISGYAQHGEGLLALECFGTMQAVGIRPDEFTFSSALKACTCLGAIEQGRYIHEQAIESNLHSDVVVGSALVDMYSKCWSLGESCAVFDKLPNKNFVTWSAMVLAFSQQSESHSTMQCFDCMQHWEMKLDKSTFLNILKVCGRICVVEQCRRIHELVLRNGMHHDIAVGSTLVDTYAKCGNLEEAQRVFSMLPERDVVTWSTMIAGYVEYGEGLLALDCFETMLHDGMQASKVTFLSTLKACSSIGAIQHGRWICSDIIENAFSNDIVIANTVIDMYAKCGNLQEARKAFNNVKNRDVVTWAAMIAGYVQNDDGLLALKCFHSMQNEGIQPDKFTFSSALKACGSLGAIQVGRDIHQQIVGDGLEPDLVVACALVDMYARCGNMDEASLIFNKLQHRDVYIWCAMIAGHAQRGSVKLASGCLIKMQQESIMPNEIVFATMLAACSHAGLVAEGIRYFRSMVEDHDLIPDACHYSCIVDLFSRAGHLNGAGNLLHNIQPDIISLMSLLAACKTYGNVELGIQCFDQIVHLDPHHAGGYVLMSGIYGDACMWKEAGRVEEMRKDLHAWKKPGKAWIEVDNKVHEFVVGDKNHPQNEEICARLKILSAQMKELGYKPRIDLVLRQMSDENKEDALCGHCEKLAIAFGLISTTSGTSIRAAKNLRMCMDCHNVTKFTSKIEHREIIIRDAYRIHHFSDGFCSCGDYI